MRLHHLVFIATGLSLAFACTPADLATVPDEGVAMPDSAILAMVRNDVVNTAYYKDLFLDGMCFLNPGIKISGVVSNGMLPRAVKDCGFTCEYLLSVNNDPFATPYAGDENTLGDKARLQRSLAGTDEDRNGVLLYPDGEPRFRMMFIFGGSSGNHGSAVGAAGRANVRTFYANGGSVCGSCAGAYLTGRYASGSEHAYYNLVTGANMIATGLNNSSTQVILTENSPLLEYFDFPADRTIDAVRHNGGGYLDAGSAPRGTEILSTFGHSPRGGNEKFFGKPNAWAYKASSTSGRVAVSGSHPEDGQEGNLLHYSESLFRYAYDGSGAAKVKGVLHNGQPRDMIYADSPSYCPIGDLQCHHFVVWLPCGAKSMKVDLDASGNFDMQLFLKKDSFAFPESSPDFKSAGGGPDQSIDTGKISAGLWYVTVRCNSTVTAEEKEVQPSTGKGRYFEYTGDTEVLNGVPYILTASWEAEASRGD